MSAFVVSTECMQRVVWTLLEPRSMSRPSLAAAVGMVCESHRELWEALYSLNVDAVTQRYGTGAATMGTGEAYRAAWDKSEPRPDGFSIGGAPVVAYKAIQSLLYQCAEGDVAESPAFAALERAGLLLAADIVSELPHYDAAPWG